MEYLSLLNLLLLPALAYIIKVEKRLQRLEIIVKQVCEKVKFYNGG